MKKIVTLVLVLSMVSVASAGLQISVNGVQNPGVIEIMPSDTLTLDIWTDEEIGLFGGVPAWALVCSTDLGVIIGGIDQLPTNPGVFVGGLTQDNATVIPPAGDEGIWGGAMAVTAPIAAMTTLIDQIDFHCEGIGDVVITLYPTIENVGVGAALDSVIIHQIPEPATMALLGLGGLLLRRKK